MNGVTVPAIHRDVEEVLLTEQQIHDRVAQLGQQLAEDYAGRSPVLVSVLKGSIIFMADLIRATPIPLSLDLMEVSSYGSGTETSGQVRILKDLSSSIQDRDVIVVEDIIDTGLTLNYLLRYLGERHPASIRICCLLDKPARRLADIEIDYRGFTIPDRFVVGYGLDYDERYRNLPYVGVLRPSVYSPAHDED
jgi:hypoxanthine phosphoribosyltransferase